MTAAMSISQFKSKLAGKAARPNLFEVIPAWPAPIASFLGGKTRDFVFFCKAASIPSGTMGTINTPFRGRQLKLPGDRTYEPWNLTILNDNDYTYRRALERWQTLMNDAETNIRNVNLESLLTDWRVYQINQQGQRVQGYNLVDLWPQALSTIELSNDNVDTIEEYTVTLEYQYWTHVDDGGSLNFNVSVDI